MSTPFFRFRCPACGHLMSASIDKIGGAAICGNCDTVLEVPRPERLLAPAGEPSASIVAQERPVTFRAVQSTSDDELDLTPMVDVTFLLLIFFMVTASFQIQKSLEVPVPRQDLPSLTAQQQESPEDDPDNILVRIDSLNTYFVSCVAWDREREAPSEQELLRQMRLARESNREQPPRTLLVIAHVEALHEKVVAALDAGADVGIDTIRLMSSEEDP